MERMERILYMLERSLNTKKRRHLAGGIFASVSIFFGGLAITALTLRDEEKEVIDEQRYID